MIEDLEDTQPQPIKEESKDIEFEEIEELEGTEDGENV